MGNSGMKRPPVDQKEFFEWAKEHGVRICKHQRWEFDTVWIRWDFATNLWHRSDGKVCRESAFRAPSVGDDYGWTLWRDSGNILWARQRLDHGATVKTWNGVYWRQGEGGILEENYGKGWRRVELVLGDFAVDFREVFVWEIPE